MQNSSPCNWEVKLEYREEFGEMLDTKAGLTSRISYDLKEQAFSIVPKFLPFPD